MPVPNNTFPLDEYIKAIENPDKRGLVGNRWLKSPRRVDDPNNRGYGIDIRYNEKAKALTEGRPGRWLSVAEEEKLRQDHIKESQRAAREHFHEYLRQQPLTPKREALAVGMLYRGDGINKHREVADAYYNGTEEELQEAITKYYEGKQPERAKLHKKFIEKTSEEISNNNKWNQLFNQEQFQAPSIKAEGGSLKDATPWNNLSVAEKAEMMRVAIHNGIFDLPTIKAKYNEFAEGGSKDKGMTGMMNLYSEGGYAPSKAIKSQIAKWEGSAMTGAIDPLSGKYSKNNSFEAEAKGFYNALPDNIRAQVLSNPELADHLYSYSYNVGAGNFKKRVVPALEKYYSGNGSIEDVVDSMWASGDSKLKGLQIRRAVEKTGVRQALLNDAINSTNAPYIPVIPEAFNTPAETPTYQTPIYALEDLEIPAYQPTAEEVERQNRRDALDRFNTVMQLLGIDNPIQATYPTTGNSFLDVLGTLNDREYSEGGSIHIKPENRGKFTALKERTGHSATWFKEHGTPAQKKMAIFDLNSRHWKHGDGGDLHIYNGGEKQQTNNRLQDEPQLKWMENWLSQRKDILQNNAEKTTWRYSKYEPRKNTGDVRKAGWTAKHYDNWWNPFAYLKESDPTRNRVNKLIFSQIENARNTPKQEVGSGSSADYNMRGAYVQPDSWDNSGNYIAFAGQNVDPATKVHEFTHASHPTQQERYIADIIFKGRDIPKAAPKAKNKMDNAKELYGALQEFRYKNGLLPKQKIDQKYIDEHRAAFKGNYLETLSDSDKLRLFNEVASNNSFSQNDNMAAYGGNLYDGGGDLISLLPTINIPEAIGNAYNAVKERAYKTITPQDYNIPRATKEFVRGKERNLKAVEPVRNEEWAMYLGVPYEGESNFEPSPYRPTKGKTYDKVLKFKDESKILSDAVLNQMLERQKKTGKTSYLVTGNGGGLGSYTLSLGEDENGKYISYYDDWDINPFKGISATTKIPIVSDIEDIIPGSNPFTVYGRRYYSKKTNKKKSLGGHI